MSTSRFSKLTSVLDLPTQVGLEIGPLCWPVVTRDKGKVYFIDHASTEDLKIKYADAPNVPVDKIVDVDFVLGSRTVSETVGSSSPFDYVIASHVIEHVPDLIGFLRDLTKVLRVGGFICLCIPDKRYTFDYFRTETVLSDVVEPYLNKQRRPGPRQIFDHFANHVQLPLESVWAGTLDPAALGKDHELKVAWDWAKRACSSDEYIDCHCHVFTPNSFLQVLRGCFELELLELAIRSFWETAPNESEFFAVLQRLDPAAGREAMLEAQTKSLSIDRGFLAGSSTGGFMGQIFYLREGVRYHVPTAEWGQEAGFHWPESILWMSDEEIARYRATLDPIPAPETVKAAEQLQMRRR